MAAILTTAVPDRAAVDLVTARLPLRLVALDPIHHGAGVSGNTTLIRRQTVIAGDGTLADVPFISGNSVRHHLRAALAEHAVRVLEVPEHGLAKRVVDLLWSGGALTETGNQIDLEAQRRMDALAPMVSLLGYSARSDIVSGPLRADHVHVVCAQNAWRLPSDLAEVPHAQMWEGQTAGEEFGTRHDAAHSAGRWISPEDAVTMIDKTTQMIYDMQVIRPGTRLWGTLYLDNATRAHADALAVAVDEAWPHDGDRRIARLGGKTAQGFGRCQLDVDLSPLGEIAEARTRHEDLLRGHRDAILELLAATVG
ncbi:hypothetical protein [Frankia sp. Cj3]|uniref:hypothetical protein n=1 Tax=Frankia sp. Cj3 TaxID=2880976 RepID=UPI001EF53E8B|nr:hypothetical protein [Frankia sp. Cj3]